MAEMGWLLNISLSPDQERSPAEFTIWLHKLDDPEERAPVCVTTVDELLTVLVAAWQQRGAGPPGTA